MIVHVIGMQMLLNTNVQLVCTQHYNKLQKQGAI
jgi:hypothetical protein